MTSVTTFLLAVFLVFVQLSVFTVKALPNLKQNSSMPWKIIWKIVRKKEYRLKNQLQANYFCAFHLKFMVEHW